VDGLLETLRLDCIGSQDDSVGVLGLRMTVWMRWVSGWRCGCAGSQDDSFPPCHSEHSEESRGSVDGVLETLRLDCIGSQDDSVDALGLRIAV